jgi:hypothetical protein
MSPKLPLWGTRQVRDAGGGIGKAARGLLPGSTPDPSRTNRKSQFEDKSQKSIRGQIAKVNSPNLQGNGRQKWPENP